MSHGRTLHRVPRHPHAWLGWLLASQALVAALWWWAGWRVGLPAMLLSHAPFVLAALLPRASLYAPVLSRLPTGERVAWLTIDDGPSDDTLAMLDLLDRHRARATFFLVGERAAARPQLVREILGRGHGIGNHSHTHPQAWFWALGPRRMAREIGEAQATLAALAGAPPRWFRSVVGMTNPFVAAPLRRHGLARVAWSARGFDAVRGDPDAVAARIGRDLAPGAIVLLHEGAPHGRSVEIVARVLERLQAAGYRTVLPEDPAAAHQLPSPQPLATP
ncbi:polysaccharide deacetylase family protein [Luteimonas sp. SJ-92]|uniref:Polysaccharide deacetylase family protein n=1 Tax=Luteimonas salinisoli TaxID=2752307 RepID=A0A853JFE9_9GAMM|nr:polysaccharide deacetylase family protein [Luteimonas salinisoli]NZA27260.1 polysaccharide deacetylase family protein [Luteimonas salinisoli]